MGFDISSLSSITKDISRTVKSFSGSVKSISGKLGTTKAIDLGYDLNAATKKIQKGFTSGGLFDLKGLGDLGGYGSKDSSSSTDNIDSATGTKQAGGPSIQTSSTGAEKGAFKWVEQFITPDMFATADSCLIGYGAPLRGNNPAGSDFKLIGFCQNLNISTGVNVVTFKELRNERTIVIPTKSTPGSISISRMLGNMPDFMSTVVKGTGWKMDSHSIDCKQLFGLVLIFMSSSRANTISSLYAERCAVQTMSVPVQAGQFQLYQNIQIIFDRLIDGTNTVSPNKGETISSSTGATVYSPNTSKEGLNDTGLDTIGTKGINDVNNSSKGQASTNTVANKQDVSNSMADSSMLSAARTSQVAQRTKELETETRRIASYDVSADVKLQLTLDSNARLNKKYPGLTPLTERGTDSKGYAIVGHL